MTFFTWQVLSPHPTSGKSGIAKKNPIVEASCSNFRLATEYNTIQINLGWSSNFQFLNVNVCRFQDQLYEIEEEKMMKPQEHIDLSLNLIKNPPSSKEAAAVGKVNVSEMDTKDIMNKFKLNTNTVNNVLLGSEEGPRELNNTARRINRATLKLEAAKVSSLIFT